MRSFRSCALAACVLFPLGCGEEDERDGDEGASLTDTDASGDDGSAESGSGSFEQFQCRSLAACAADPGQTIEVGGPICASAQGVNAYMLLEAGCLLACAGDDIEECVSMECEPTGTACECADETPGFCASS